MKTILNYVQENYNRDISIEEISKLCNFSEYYFMRFFKKYSGTSCLKYINNYRLEKAAELLKSTAYSITDISLECGFNNLSYFNKLFKRKYKFLHKEQEYSASAIDIVKKLWYNDTADRDPYIAKTKGSIYHERDHKRYEDRRAP